VARRHRAAGGVYNWGIAGKFLSDCYNDRAATDGTIYVSDRPIVYIIQAGINDIHAGGALATAVYGTSAAANTTWGYVSYLKGLATAAGKTNVKVMRLHPPAADRARHHRDRGGAHCL
jgi:hypothetical protein